MTQKQAIAFKEWASVVQALGAGAQTLIFRKGGIHEKANRFQVEHDTFFLFPTYEHQKLEDLAPESQKFLSELTLPEKDFVTIKFWCEVHNVFWVDQLELLMKLSKFHSWSSEAIKKKFFWGEKPGLFVMAVRIYQLPEVKRIKLLPRYGGCRSWVELEESISHEHAKPVLSDAAFQSSFNALTQLMTTPF